MKKKIIGLLIIMVLIAIMLGTYIKKQIDESKEIEDELGYEMNLDNAKQGIQKGQPAPDFTLETLDGESVTLSELKGKKVVLNFWATWCPPCKEEMPDLQKYYEKYAKQDNVEIVAVNLTFNDSSIETIQQFVDSYKLSFPVLLMKNDDLVKKYQVITIPSTFMIDTKGRIQNNFVGPLNQETLRDFVKSVD